MKNVTYTIAPGSPVALSLDTPVPPAANDDPYDPYPEVA